MINEIIEKLRREKQQECETCSCSYSFWCQGYEKALDHVIQQVKSVDLDDVGGSYSVKDMGDAWSAGYHRRADEDNGKEVTSFTDWIEMTYGGK